MMDDVFDETADDLEIAKKDTKLIETLRFTDGFRDGMETSEQHAFETGFIRGYSLLSKFVYDFYLEKDRLRLTDPTDSFLTNEMEQYEREFRSIVDQLKQTGKEKEMIETLENFIDRFETALESRKSK